MIRVIISFFLSILFSKSLCAQNIQVSGNRFTLDGKEIYLNGVNAPWQWQSDCDINFMRRNFDRSFWEAELQKYADNKVNVVRVWLHGSGNYSPALNGSGSVTAYGTNDLFWQNMDTLVNIAARKKLFLMPAFWSFDMASTNAYYYSQYRQILTDDNKAGSYIDNFLIPFVQRYKNNKWIMGYDLCNEPEHIWRDQNCGQLSAYWVTRFFARCAAAVHENCSQPVTIGAMWAIYNSNKLGNGDGDSEGGFNRYSDLNIKNYYDHPKAYLDFYSPHWYQWQSSNGPFNRTVSQWIGSDDKPVITGETYGGDLSFITMADFYNNSYTNGFDGTMGWKNACQNDGYGTWDGVKSGTLSFYNAHTALVYPYISNSPYGGTPWNIPGKTEAENYDAGGENISYHDTEPENKFNLFRTNEAVDIEAAGDAGGGYNAGYIETGEWLEYTVDVQAAGMYTLEARVASGTAGTKSLHVEMDGVDISGPLTFSFNSGWQAWQTVSAKTQMLSTGKKIMRIAMDAGGFNLNYLTITNNLSARIGGEESVSADADDNLFYYSRMTLER